MNQLANINSDVTMSSLDFLNNFINPARVGQKEKPVRNSDFISRVEDEIDDLPVANFSQAPRGGTPMKFYQLNMEQMTLVGMRESKTVRRAVLEKLKQLAPRKEEVALPGNYIEALEALIESEKQKAIMAPKAQVFDRIVERTNLLNATQVGQAVGMSAIKLNQNLTELDVYNRNIKRSKAFQQWFVDGGYGEMKQTEQGYPQALFTTSGQAWVVQKFTSEGII